MAKVLVVDDNAANRDLVVTLLKYKGHEPLEAADGAEALAMVRVQRPQLVISDILMPTMDGYEFVRQLRSDPALARTEVIFYSAHYREREARNLAKVCGVSRVLVKPCEPEDILVAIEQGLAHAPEPVPPPVAVEFDREHLRLMTDKLTEKAEELVATNARLAALNDINLQLASELDPHVLLEKVCRSARDLIGARYAILCVREKQVEDTVFFTTSGVGPAFAAVMKPPRIDGGPLGPGLHERRSRRFDNPGADPIAAGLPPGFPRVHACVAAPVASLKSVYGWICLTDKLGADAFSEEDERLLTTLAAQVGRIYENGALYAEVRRHAARLQNEVTERKQAELRIQRLNRVYAMLSGINALIVRVRDRDELFRRACRLAVEHGRFQLAWVGSVDPTSKEIVPAAWAGEEESFARLTRFPLGSEAGTDRDVIAASISSREPVAIDVDAQTTGLRYRDEMLARDFHSAAGLPLSVDGEVVGYLAFYTDEAGFFDDEEMRLLTELAGDISFALDHMEKERRLATWKSPTA